MSLTITHGHRAITVPIPSVEVSGVEARFMILTRTQRQRLGVTRNGLKYYLGQSRREVLIPFLRQQRAAAFKLAPPVGEMVMVIDSAWPNHVHWGYTTAVAKDIKNVPAYQRDDLVDPLRVAGMDADDLHDENVGRYRGRVVCIDFGRAGNHKISTKERRQAVAELMEAR